jgi:hypothetical protein
MNKGGYVRLIFSAAVLLVTAACVPANNWSPWVPWNSEAPPQLWLSNFRFDHASVQAVVTANPDCAADAPNATALAFDLPLKGMRLIDAAPAADICWRRQLPSGEWTPWNRAYTATGHSIDAQL